ncbi:MAG: PLP-dependent transferase [Clostridiales bacterium]|nr:PLP-dependent transferase [Clostridiales bacterium]
MALLREQDRKYTTPEDICAHLGEDYEEYFGAVNPPIYQTSLFGKTERPKDYVYTRVSNPTTEVAERKIAALEGADGAICFASGMGAITAAIMHYIRPACHVICVATTYPDAKRFCRDYLKERAGVSCTLVKGESIEEIEKAIRPETTLIYLESPSTTMLKMQDLEAIANLAKAHNIGTVIDNTYATPLFQNPLKWGIDISIHTVSKYLGGHSDIVGGVICARKELLESIQHNERSMLGSILGPQESYLLIRGMRTLPQRMRKHGENGMIVSRYLENHPMVSKVYYPGGDTYQQKELFEKYMSGTTGLMSLQINGTPQQAQTFVNSLKVFREGVSWGGFESLVSGKTIGMPPERCIEEDVDTNVIRLHVGMENIDTLLKDLEQALDAASKA